MGNKAQSKIVSKKSFCLIISFVTAACFVAAVYLKSGIFFETNDDRYIASMLSGTLSGSANPHTYVISPLAGIILSALYSLTSSISWYGLFLCTLQAIAYSAVIFCVSGAFGAENMSTQLLHICMGIFAAAGLAISGFYTIGMLEFTSTAMILASAGYFCLIIDERNYKLFILLELLSAMVRIESMLLIQLPGGLVCIGLMLVFLDRKKALKSALKYISGIIGIITAILAIKALFGELDKEWRNYAIHDAANKEIFDYYGKPAYEDIADILAKYSVSKEQYEAYCEYMMLEDFPLSCEREIARYASRSSGNTRLINFFENLKTGILFDAKWDMNRPIFAVLLLLAVYIAISRRLKLLLPLALAVMGYTLAFSYLFYIDRALLRVTTGLYAGETAVLIALCIKFLKEDLTVVRRYAFIPALIILLAVTGIHSGRQQYRYIRQENEGQRIYMQGLYEITDYCDSNEGNKYMLDADSVSYYHGGALETYVYGAHNYRLSGGWFSYMPYIQKSLKEYFGNTDGFYYIVYADGNEENRATMRYLTRLSGGAPQRVDDIPLSPGGACAVYYFSGTIY